MALTGGLSLLSARLVYVQVVDHEYYSLQAKAKYVHKETLTPSRGRILDRNGELLARNQTVYSLVVDCFQVRDMGVACLALAKEESERTGKPVSARAMKRRYERAIRIGKSMESRTDELQSLYLGRINEVLAPQLRVPKHELAKLLKSKDKGEIVLAKYIEDDFYRDLQDILDENRLGGIYLRKGERRFYPSPLALTHVMGYMGERDGEENVGIYEGKEGIEKVFNDAMTGTAGYRYIERDRKTREIHAFRGEEQLPVAGNNVRLTIDMGLQVMVEEKMEEAVEKFAPEKITTIWMDPRNGEVLAMASRPHFDLESRKGIRRNAAVSDTYEPGSTFKIVAYGAAYDKGLITPTSPIFCHWGKYNLEGFVLNDHHPYGELSAEMGFAKSSNISAYMVARGLNKDLFRHYISEFGFGKKTGIELTAESAGINSKVSAWNASSFSSKAMGYSVAVTPLQMITAMGVIANGGGYQAPTILKAVETQEGKVIQRPERKAQTRVISQRAASYMVRSMKKVMGEGGTGSKGAFPGYTIAAKTGTARKNVEGVGYVTGRYVVSFMGFFPADDPQLMGIVIVDDPHATGVNLYGGTIAGPIFAEMGKGAVKLLGITPDKPEELRDELNKMDPIELTNRNDANGAAGE